MICAQILRQFAPLINLLIMDLLLMDKSDDVLMWRLIMCALIVNGYKDKLT